MKKRKHPGAVRRVSVPSRESGLPRVTAVAA